MQEKCILRPGIEYGWCESNQKYSFQFFHLEILRHKEISCLCKGEIQRRHQNCRHEFESILHEMTFNHMNGTDHMTEDAEGKTEGHHIL